jgi:hypothetical protein
VNVTFVASSTLAAVCYDKSRALLRLKFRSGLVYDYFGVPGDVHETLLRAPSTGACFNERIRGCFPYRRVCPAASEVRREGEP